MRVLIKKKDEKWGEKDKRMIQLNENFEIKLIVY